MYISTQIRGGDEENSLVLIHFSIQDHYLSAVKCVVVTNLTW